MKTLIITLIRGLLAVNSLIANGFERPVTADY